MQVLWRHTKTCKATMIQCITEVSTDIVFTCQYTLITACYPRIRPTLRCNVYMISSTQWRHHLVNLDKLQFHYRRRQARRHFLSFVSLTFDLLEPKSISDRGASVTSYTNVSVVLDLLHWKTWLFSYIVRHIRKTYRRMGVDHDHNNADQASRETNWSCRNFSSD